MLSLWWRPVDKVAIKLIETDIFLKRLACFSNTNVDLNTQASEHAEGKLTNNRIKQYDMNVFLSAINRCDVISLVMQTNSYF